MKQTHGMYVNQRLNIGVLDDADAAESRLFFFHSCQLLMIFCQRTYDPGPTAERGFKYVCAIHIANMVFFCPRACPALMRSPYFEPIFLPK